MRILYISNEYPPETGVGGIGTYTKNMARGMASRGHDVHVICRSASGTAAVATDAGVTVHRIGPGSYPLPSSRALYLFRAACRMLAAHCLQRLAWAREAFNEYVRIGPFDVVEYPECGGEGFYFKAAARKRVVRVARLHTPWELVATLDNIRETIVERILLSHLDRSSARRATAVSCPSQALATMMEKRWSLGNIRVFSNPIPADEYPLSTGRDWIYLGRVERRKGVHILVEAYARLAKQTSLPLLRIVGRPYGATGGVSYGDHIRNLIERHGLTKSVEWIQGSDHDSVKRFLTMSSVAIFPSLWENLAYGCLEAMACGCAVVASRCGGFPEIIRDNGNGLLFTPGDPDDLARVLDKLNTGDATFARALGVAARETVRTACDTAAVCGIAETWYADLAARRRA